jgi:hypothetical protein
LPKIANVDDLRAAVSKKLNAEVVK